MRSIRFLADENFDNNILRGIWLRQPKVDIVRVQDLGLYSADDEAVLKLAAAEERVLLTHDVKTITAFAHARVRNGHAMPGVLEVPKHLPLGTVIADLLFLAEVSTEADWRDQIHYLPLR